MKSIFLCKCYRNIVCKRKITSEVCVGFNTLVNFCGYNRFELYVFITKEICI